MNSICVSRVWYTTCDGHLIGIIKTKDTVTNEIKYRIGHGYGLNIEDDTNLIMKYGSRLYPEQLKIMFDKES